MQHEINKKYLAKNFPMDYKYKFGENKQLRHFFQIFLELYFEVFSRYRYEYCSRRFNSQASSTHVFRSKIKCKFKWYMEWTQEITTTCRSLRRNFALSLILWCPYKMCSFVSSFRPFAFLFISSMHLKKYPLQSYFHIPTDFNKLPKNPCSTF